MKVVLTRLKGVSKVAGSGRFIKKYLMDYELTDDKGEVKSMQYELASRNEIKSKKDVARNVNAVSIICRVVDTGEFIVLYEFRYATNKYVYDFPAGLVDKGETIQEAARRELFEETGLTGFKVITVLDGGFSSAGMTDERVAICYGEVASKQGITTVHTEGAEDISVLSLPMTLLISLCENSNNVSSRIQNFVLGAISSYIG